MSRAAGVWVTQITAQQLRGRMKKNYTGKYSVLRRSAHSRSWHRKSWVRISTPSHWNWSMRVKNTINYRSSCVKLNSNARGKAHRLMTWIVDYRMLKKKSKTSSRCSKPQSSWFERRKPSIHTLLKWINLHTPSRSKAFEVILPRKNWDWKRKSKSYRIPYTWLSRNLTSSLQHFQSCRVSSESSRAQTLWTGSRGKMRWW